MLTSADLAHAVERMHARIDSLRDELNAADRLLGDGDTGMTIAQVVKAWGVACADLPADVGEAFVLLGRETGRATGSSLGAVLATGLSAAGRSVRGTEAVDSAGIALMLSAAAQKITERSGATAGAKSFLDSLLRVEQDLRNAGTDGSYGLADAVASTAGALSEFRERESKLGRARMYGEKSRGHDDPGMLAAYLLLNAAR